MARKRLVSADQPWWMRAVLHVYEFSASLRLAVVLIFTCAAVLAVATFVESKYGTPAVQFGIYGTWWFGWLNALLAWNIFCAAAIRFPWKRHQTGFVITHIGLLTLLFGCLLSRRGGIDAQLPVFEGHVEHRAFEESHHVELVVQPEQSGSKPENLPIIPLKTGPFNWRDYGTLLPTFPWDFSRRHDAGDVLYDADGIRVEILDFLADSRLVDVPRLKLKLVMPSIPGRGEMGDQELPVFTVRSPDELAVDCFPHGLGSQQRAGGGLILFWLAGSAVEVEAFQRCLPEGSLGSQGQIALLIDGQVHRLQVEDVVDQGRVPIEGTTVEVEIPRWVRSASLAPGDDGQGVRLIEEAARSEETARPGVEVLVHRPGKPPSRLLLFADLPHISVPDFAGDLHGAYWYDHGEKSSVELLQGTGEGGSRIDIVQGPDEKLYARYWNRREVVWSQELPTDGKEVDAFKMPMAQLRLAVTEFIPSQEPKKATLPHPFDKDKVFGMKRAAGLFRVTVDGQQEEMWIAGIPGEPGDRTPRADEMGIVRGDGRFVSMTMPPDAIDIGFGIRLRNFERKLDPGTSQPSHFSSTVDFVQLGESQSSLRDDVWITMNAPVDFKSPTNGQSYRLFQESFGGPYVPGEHTYRVFATEATGENLYYSILTVNYDPGRGIKYAGCLLIVGGIGTMFYMRAYFFKSRPPSVTTTARAKAPAPRKVREPATTA